ncbi:hypothetical protein AAHA92_32913 [Salvia divinorum]|uniref:Uncharacterized protein n=1 Tax=Salvia divinorum TaxID=28513 RepID=A0ABD1FM88_SALDI
MNKRLHEITSNVPLILEDEGDETLNGENEDRLTKHYINSHAENLPASISTPPIFFSELLVASFSQLQVDSGSIALLPALGR